jgi:antitoxin component YwqK of YwqJK toxin-antitoxin module
MLNWKIATHGGSRWLLAALAIQISGCMAYNKTSSDFERTPIVNTGTRAAIIYPGQGAPAMPGSVPHAQQVPPGANSQYAQPPTPEQQPPYPPNAPVPPGATPAPQPQASPQSGSAPDGQISFLGGSRMEESQHVDIRKEPLVVKYLTAPFKLVAAPFVLAKEALEGEPEPGPAVPRRPDPQLPHAQSGAGTAQPAQHPGTDYETAMLENMERQLDERRPTEQREAPQQSIASARAPSLSIADELRELQRAPEVPRSQGDHPSPPAPSTFATTPPSREPGNLFPSASGIVDRNNDGRIDQWIFRENGEIAKEVLDEDFDGRPDRTMIFDPQTHRPSRVEEDTLGDGVLDSWTDYRNGAISRRRSDSNGDGTVDTWSFFRAGELTRHEQDTSGDGFRDVVSFFEEGRRVREERDVNGDGQADEILHYDSNEQLVRREEDRDRDGALEVVSHYEAGRLVRRELLDVPALAGRLSETESSEATR